MLALSRSILLLVAIFAGLAVSRDGCRQCIGHQKITFGTAATELDATNFFKKSLSGCASNGEMIIKSVTPGDCSTYKGFQVCKSWDFYIFIWRYCGNGGSNFVDKGAHCIDGVCSSTDIRTLTCNRSVECRSDCSKYNCGL